MKLVLVMALICIALFTFAFLIIPASWHGDNLGHFYGATLIEHLKHKQAVLRAAHFFRH
ncbi:hypothetical protein [Vibrio marisflavi]|uniref:hypothetical protein n=1 Tax=Vibrio marisflavi TaxID=1216040 RepID=UPI001F38B0D7|nr:hypothetical protein [Vibrio marisflavi]